MTHTADNHTPARLYVSAAHKSSGKTTLSIGLCRALQQRGYAIHPFKKGPDYIDPLWLSAASVNPCYNLDFNTLSHDEILTYLTRYSSPQGLAFIEGNKGLYDGMDVDGADSNAALAKLVQAPVVLVINSQGTTRGLMPLLLGYQQFDPDINIAGVIFNRVGGGGHAKRLKQLTQHYTDIPVLGMVRNDKRLVIEERHLGLMPSNESAEAESIIESIAEIVADSVDLKRLLTLTGSPTLPLTIQQNTHRADSSSASVSTLPAKANPIRLGICHDAAFGFYYQSDLEALQLAGAELVNIDTINDQSLPAIDGLFIGGGFPETQAKALAANTALKASIKQAIEEGLPTYAECGGLMYLTESLQWHGEQHEMVGIIPAKTIMCQRPQGRGLVRVRTTVASPWPLMPSGKLIKAHEFHYSRLEVDEERLTKKGQFAYAMERGVGINGQYDGWVYKNLLASYTHLRDAEQCQWASAFVDFIADKQVGYTHDPYYLSHHSQ